MHVNMCCVCMLCNTGGLCISQRIPSDHSSSDEEKEEASTLVHYFLPDTLSGYQDKSYCPTHYSSDETRAGKVRQTAECAYHKLPWLSLLYVWPE